jgi:hypothetical protein
VPSELCHQVVGIVLRAFGVAGVRGVNAVPKGSGWFKNAAILRFSVSWRGLEKSFQAGYYCSLAGFLSQTRWLQGKESAQRIIEAMNTTSMPSKVGSFAPTDFPEPPLGLASQSLCRPRMTSTPVGQSALEPSHSRWSKRARTATTI